MYEASSTTTCYASVSISNKTGEVVSIKLRRIIPELASSKSPIRVSSIDVLFKMILKPEIAGL
jgi:hypothetical protein